MDMHSAGFYELLIVLGFALGLGALEFYAVRAERRESGEARPEEPGPGARAR